MRQDRPTGNDAGRATNFKVTKAMNTPDTGRQQLNRQLVEGAASLAGPAADLASGASLMKTASNAMRDAMLDKLLGPTAVFAGGLVGVLRTVRSIVRESQILEKGLKQIASTQQITGKFETLLKSATAAKRRIEELYKFTAQSPFDFKDVAEGNRILQALTQGAFAGTKAMKIVGDAAAATGQSMAEMSERVSKLYAALASGRSFEKIAFQLQFSGIVTDELAGKLEALESQGASFSSKWSEVEKVLARTADGMKNEIETLDALSTRLDNANAMMAKAFGEPYIDAQVKAMKVMIAATQNLTPIVAEIGKDFSVLPNLIRDGKNTLLDTVAASQRFAESLKAAYRVAVSLFVGLAGATAVAAARNLFGLGNAALATATAMRTAYAANLAVAKAQAALAAASALSTAATEAFTRGSLLSAAALKAESFWLGVKTRTLAANAAAARLAGAGTAAYSVGAHAAGLATAGLAGTLKLVGKGLGFVFGLVRGSAVALLTNPWTAAALAITTAAVAIYKWGAAAREASKNSRELADSIADTTRRLDAQSAAVKSITDWQKNVESLRQRYNDLTAAVDAFNRKVANGEDVTREETAANAKNLAERKQTRAAMDKEMRRNTRGLDLSDAEKDRIREDQANVRAAKDRDFRLAVGSAETPEQRLALYAERKAELEKRIEDGRTAKAAEETATRNGSAARLMQMQQKRDDIAARFDQSEQSLIDKRDRFIEGTGAKKNAQGNWAGVAVSPVARDMFAETEKQLRALRARRNFALEAAESDIRNESLTSSSPTVKAQAELDEAVRTGAGPARIEELVRALNDAVATVAGLADAENELAELRATETQETKDLAKLRTAQNVANDYDAKINAAKTAGRPTSGLEFEKALALAEGEKTDAKTPEEIQAAQNKIDAMHAEREAGRREIERERAINSARANGDRKGAQAIEDAGALQSLIERYDGLGLSADQARADFTQGLIADAAGQRPNIVASSTQAIGGGGFAYQGRDPMLAAEERAQRSREQALKEVTESKALLRDIRDKLSQED